MQEQTAKEQRPTKTRTSRDIPVVDIARLAPPTADALREAHMNLIRAEQNLYSLIQANPAGSALLGIQPGFGHADAYAAQAGSQAPAFGTAFARPVAFPGFAGIGNGLAPSVSPLGTHPAATVSQWAPWMAATPAAQVPALGQSGAGQALAPITQGQGSIGRALACDIIDEGEQLICQLELPGIEADQIEVLSFGSALVVGTYREPEGEIMNLVQSERPTSAQQRIIRLPSQVQPSGATAGLANGVLTVALPKVYPTEGPRLVEIKEIKS